MLSHLHERPMCRAHEVGVRWLPNCKRSVGRADELIASLGITLQERLRTRCRARGADKLLSRLPFSYFRRQIRRSRDAYYNLEVLIDVASNVADRVQLPLKLGDACSCRLIVEQQLLVHLLQVETLALDFDQALQHCRFGVRQLRSIARIHGSSCQIDCVLQASDGGGHGRNVHLVPRVDGSRARSRRNHHSACASTDQTGRAAA